MGGDIISAHREHIHNINSAVRCHRSHVSHQHDSHFPLDLGLHQQEPRELNRHRDCSKRWPLCDYHGKSINVTNQAVDDTLREDVYFRVRRGSFFVDEDA